MLHNPIFLSILAIFIMALLPQLTALMAQFGSNRVSPEENSKNMEYYTLAAETICKWVSTLITSIGFFVFGKMVAEQYTNSDTIPIVVGFILAVISGWITDFAFSHFLENSMFGVFNVWRTPVRKQKPFQNVIGFLKWATVTAIVVALFYADYKSVYTIREPVAAGAKTGTTINTDSLSRTQQQRSKDALSPIAANIKAAENTIRQKEAQVRYNNAGLVKLSNEGNPWARGELSRKIGQATAADAKRLQHLRDEQVRVLSAQNTLNETELTAASSSNASAAATTETTKSAISGMFTQFGFGAKIMTVLLRLLLVLSFLANPSDANGDGKIDGRDVTEAAKRGGSGGKVNVRVTESQQPQHTVQQPALATAEMQQPLPSAKTNGIGFHDRYKKPAPQPPSPTPETDDSILKSGLFGNGAAIVQQSPAVQQCSTVSDTQTGGEPSEVTIEIEVPATIEPQPVGVGDKKGSEWAIAGLAEWKSRFGLYSKRAIESQSTEAREDNEGRAKCYEKMLRAAGYEAKYSPGKNPAVEANPIPGFNLDEARLKTVVSEQQEILRDLIGKRKERIRFDF